MTAGDVVIYKADPLLYGKLLVISVKEGRYTCEPVHGEHSREVFGGDELELAARVKATA